MKSKIFLAAKSFLATVFILTFFVLMLKIENEGRKKTQDKEVLVHLNKKTIYLKNADKEYLIEPDKEKLVEVFNNVYSHPLILPCPFSFCVISKNLVEEFF